MVVAQHMHPLEHYPYHLPSPGIWSINKKVPAIGQPKNEESEGNLAEIVTNDSSNELTLGNWCRFTTDPTNMSKTPDTNLGTWITAVSRSFKKKRPTLPAITAAHSFTDHYWQATLLVIGATALYSVIIESLAGSTNAHAGGYYYTNPKTGRVSLVPFAFNKK